MRKKPKRSTQNAIIHDSSQNPQKSPQYQSESTLKKQNTSKNLHPITVPDDAHMCEMI